MRNKSTPAGNRTLINSLKGYCSAIELRGYVVIKHIYLFLSSKEYLFFPIRV